MQQYALALDNPPLLIVCDLDTIEIHTHFTNSVHTVYRLALADLADPAKLDWLRWAFADLDRLKPGQTRQRLTEDAAERFAGLAQGLRAQGHAPRTVAHFINRLVFCMFAEDVDLLPDRLFTRLLEHAAGQPDEFAAWELQKKDRWIFQANWRGNGCFKVAIPTVDPIATYYVPSGTQLM